MSSTAHQFLALADRQPASDAPPIRTNLAIVVAVPWHNKAVFAWEVRDTAAIGRVVPKLRNGNRAEGECGTYYGACAAAMGAAIEISDMMEADGL